MAFCGSMMSSFPSFCSAIPEILALSLFTVAASGITCKHDHIWKRSKAFLLMHLFIRKGKPFSESSQQPSLSGPINQDWITCTSSTCKGDWESDSWAFPAFRGGSKLCWQGRTRMAWESTPSRAWHNHSLV